MRQHKLIILPASKAETTWAQQTVAAHHYLHTPVDPRCRPFAYVVLLGGAAVGTLIFGRPESTRCYRGGLTFGSQLDVCSGRARFDRWEVLNLVRVWLNPRIQRGGESCNRDTVPGFIDRRGQWCPAVASWSIAAALARVNFDYLAARPPCFIDEPYQIRAVLSYCDTRIHRGTIYRAAGFRLARRNAVGVETWWTEAVAPMTSEQNAAIRRLSNADARADRIRNARRDREAMPLLAEQIT